MQSSRLAAGLVACLAVGAAGDALCQPGSCSCGSCAKDGGGCYHGPTKHADAPDKKDTGGRCRYFGCSNRGEGVHCNDDYRCTCKHGYFANHEQRSKCVKDETAPCWASGGMCRSVANKCSNSCQLYPEPEHYENGRVAWADWIEKLQRHFNNIQGGNQHNYYGFSTYAHPCSMCLAKHGAYEEMIACAQCLQKCSEDDDSLTLAADTGSSSSTLLPTVLFPAGAFVIMGMATAGLVFARFRRPSAPLSEPLMA